MKHLIFIVFVLWISCSQTADPPRVTMIYPSSDTLPENLLRMYVQFSEPMKTQGNLEHIRLIDESGEEIKGAIFNNVYELWDDHQKQLTIILDPARVKTGLQANKRLGRALKSNQSYQLVFENLETINHVTIAPYIKKFHVTSADTVSPNIDKWTLQIVNANTRSPLTILFPERIDQMSILHRLDIVSNKRESIKGSVSIGKDERSYSFMPDENWQAGKHWIYVNSRLADPSGNSLNGPFDHRPGSLRFESEEKTLQIPFVAAKH